MNHPNIVKCYDIIEEDQYCYIITELCEGRDLEMVIKKRGTLT